MSYEELLFEEFLASQMKEKGMNLKRLAEATGIAPSHLENMIHGNFDELPSAPYFRGYLMRIGKALGFDGEEWWNRLRKDEVVKKSGSEDELPRNRFIRQPASKLMWAGLALAVFILIIIAIQVPRVLGRPSLTLTYPTGSPFTATSSIVTLTGTVRGADVLYLSGGDASTSEEIPIASDGSWQKTVLIGESGLPNTFQITAKKLLGGETTVTEQILYGGPVSAVSSSSSTSTPPAVHVETNTPGPGPYYE